MTDLTANKASFIQYMLKSDDHARKGFELLLEQANFSSYFDSLQSAGFFSPQKNSGPIPSSKEGYFQVPFWSSLSYLTECSKYANEHNDVELGEKVLNVLRSVSASDANPEGIKRNYHTARTFTEIMGNLPLSLIKPIDIGLFREWLSTEFDRGLVASELCKGLLPKLIGSENPLDWEKAFQLLNYCIEVEWVEEKGITATKLKPQTVVDDYWLKELLKKNIPAFGLKIPQKTAELFVQKIIEVYLHESFKLQSWLYRPAIEDHKQNHDWRGPENRLVEGLRDTLLTWNDKHNDALFINFISALLHHEVAILRRVAIYVINQRWGVLKELFLQNINVSLFNMEHLHELYNLLNRHFNEFNEAEQQRTLDAISQITVSANSENPELIQKKIKRLWLSSIADKQIQMVDNVYAKLVFDNELGALQSHPDFNSYMETSWGPGPSIYSTSDLVAFAENGQLLDKLNEFVQTSTWRGPTLRALADTLEIAVLENPQTFEALIISFKDAKTPYQYALVAGFKALWSDTSGKYQQLIWDKVWCKLFDFFEAVIGAKDFWLDDKVNGDIDDPNKQWLISSISELLKSGLQNDSHAFPESLISRSWTILNTILLNTKGDAQAHTDALTHAINNTRGKAIDALFNCALRTCRIADSKTGKHTEEWIEISPAFDREIQSCKDANFEFSSLIASYLPNIEYLSKDWLVKNFHLIFPLKYLKNLLAALNGLKYCPSYESIYLLLCEHKIIENSLNLNLTDDVRARLIERMAIAYVWEKDDLASPRFKPLFDNGQYTDLQVCSNLFWSLSNESITEVHVNRIMNFVDKVISDLKEVTPLPASLLSSLSLLSVFLKEITQRELDWLLFIAPFIETNYNATQFVEEMNRLVQKSPSQVSQIMLRVLDTYKPFYDYQDNLKKLIRAISDLGYRKEALLMLEKIHYLKGIPEIYEEMVRQRN